MTIPRGLIVSCQAYEGDPMFGPHIMAAMAKAAQKGGAIAIRANSPQDIKAVRQVTKLPLIGIYKVFSPDSEVYITPDFEAAHSIAEAGCDIVGVDATIRKRPNNVELKDLVQYIKDKLQKQVLADISCLEDALQLEALEVDYVSSTLAGYTSHGRPSIDGPDLEFVKELVNTVKVPVIAEGRFFNPIHATYAIQLGAHAVAVGEAITRPEKITERYVEAINSVKQLGK